MSPERLQQAERLFRAKTKKPPAAKNRFMFHQMEMAAMMKRGH